jgi:FkbM family methyltransferase
MLRPMGPLLPASIYSHLWFTGPFTVRIAGGRFRVQHRGAELENQLFWRNMFESERGTALVAARLARDATGFLDVGANSGFFSLLAKAVSPGMPVVAIEASAANFELLETNVRLNGFDVRTVAAAATASEGEVVFHDFDGPSYSASIEAGWRPGTVERRVRGVTLDAIAEETGLSGAGLLVKIDVEGHELGVLEGAPRLISQSPSFLIEIIRDYVATGVTRFLSPDRFRFAFIDEADGRLEDMTARFRDGAEIPFGNYLVTPT